MRREVKLIMKMMMPTLMLTVLLAGMALSLAAPVMADPPEPKWVATLDDGDGPVGQVILNTNDEDDTEAESYELEVEVEESALADGTYDVKLDGNKIGEIIIAGGNGKVTIPLDSLIDLGINEITVDGITSDTGTERLWVQGKGKK